MLENCDRQKRYQQLGNQEMLNQSPNVLQELTWTASSIWNVNRKHSESGQMTGEEKEEVSNCGRDKQLFDPGKSENDEKQKVETETGPGAEDLKKKTNVCDECGIEFTKKFNLERHKKTCRNHSTTKKNWPCNVPGCDLRFYRALELNLHLKNVHDASIPTKKIVFSNVNEFLTFKRNEEEKNYCSFIKQNAQPNYFRYVCNRHGARRKNNTQGKRKNKKGLCHTGLKCPASMAVSVNDNQLSVSYISMHSHPLNKDNLAFARMPDELKEEIEGYVSLQLKPNKILDLIKEPAFSRDNRNDGITRRDLIKIKDIHNIQQKFKRLERLNDDGLERDLEDVEMDYYPESQIPIVDGEKEEIKAGLEARHGTGLQIPDHSVVEINPLLYLVKSASLPDRWYEVAIKNKRCEDASCVKCPKCDVLCIHVAECECDDFVVNNYLCKHVHKIYAFSEYVQHASSEHVQNDSSVQLELVENDVREISSKGKQPNRGKIKTEKEKKVIQYCDEIKKLCVEQKTSYFEILRMEHGLRKILTQFKAAKKLQGMRKRITIMQKPKSKPAESVKMAKQKNILKNVYKVKEKF